MGDDKWLMFKNYMHNELGITKEDIQQWIDESVNDIALRMVKNEFDNFNPKKIVNELVMSDEYFSSKELTDKITRAVVKRLTTKLEITLKK
jgi:hypothetical protein